MNNSSYDCLMTDISTMLDDVDNAATRFTRESEGGLRALLVETTLNAIYGHLCVVHDLCLTASTGEIHMHLQPGTSTGGPGGGRPPSPAARRPQQGVTSDGQESKIELPPSTQDELPEPDPDWLEADAEAFDALVVGCETTMAP